MSNNQWIWGFSKAAEIWNGRLAMLAFLIVLITELSTSASILQVLDIR